MASTNTRSTQQPRRKILVVDDQKGVRRLVAAMLGVDEFQLLEAASGEEALALARTEQPRIMLLDITLPGINGFEVCRQIKAAPATSHIAVIMLTGKSDAESRKQGEAVGANAYLTKPFSPVELLNRIYHLFG